MYNEDSIQSLQTSLQDALDDLVSTRSSPGRKTRALAALERLLVLVCVSKDTGYDLDGFLRLQDKFECNVSSRLLTWISVSTLKLEGLASRASIDEDRDTEITVLLSQLSQSLSIIQGVVLNHDPSKRFLGRKYSLEVLLDLLLASRHLSSLIPLATTMTNTPSSMRGETPTYTTSIPLSSIVLDTLLCVLVDSSSALRVFEECNGVQAVVKILKTAGMPREVRMKCLEFLYFYLMDESQPIPSDGDFIQPIFQLRNEPSSSTKSYASLPFIKRAITPPSPTKTAPSTPTHTRPTKTPPSPLKSQSRSKQFTPGPRPLGPSVSSSSAFSNTWGSISSDLSSSTRTTTPEPEDSPVKDAEVPPPAPKTPSKPTSTQSMAMATNKGRLPLYPPLILRKDVDIDYVPISPKKPRIARIDTSGSSGMTSKVRGLRELSTGSRSMPALSNATPTKNLFGTPRDADPEEYGKQKGGVRTAEQKKEILSGMLGNVDALVEGVMKAGIWGLG